ncbi:hypothetical protein MJA45_13170 [Paenibacillus aurantius]|uniref:Uncharacterized protein n=1 Tax=Paenibacillus aurantius TaxID=2918900 RepID=A0AA96LJ33_9BACL|nr:hypothetical protein [Paenibacillus aurantius]WNQ13923.1 hypothetical protein MJA45_13170 [Paenibacillus aurantius]
MKGKLRMSLTRTASFIRRLVTFRFLNILPGTSRLTRSLQLTRVTNRGEVIAFQRRAVGATGTTVVRYQFVNAATGVPVSNSVTVSGNRVVVLPFVLPAGTVKLRITNVGTATVQVEGVILVF